MLFPLYGFLKGDTLGLIVLVQDDSTVEELAKTLQQAASPRVRETPHATVYFKDRKLDPTLTVAECGLEWLDRVDVVPEAPA